jgi:hypothetical protein
MGLSARKLAAATGWLAWGGLAHGREGHVIEDASHGVPDLAHDLADRTGLLVPTVGAAAIGGETGTGDRGQRSVHQPDDLTESNFGRRLGQNVAAMIAALAVHQAAVLQVEQELLDLYREMHGRQELMF